MTILQAVNNEIIKANNRMTQINIDKQILDKEWEVLNTKKWDIEKIRDLMISEDTKSVPQETKRIIEINKEDECDTSMCESPNSWKTSVIK